MGGATRFMTLLTVAPPPCRLRAFFLHPRLFSLSTAPLRLRTLPSSSKSKFRPPKVVNSFHSQVSNNTYTVHDSAQKQQQQHPWPEWTNFLNIVSTAPEFSSLEHHAILPEDAFVVYEELPDDFVHASAACLAFARARPSLLGLLSRRDIEAVVSNGTPFLFKGALDAARRMRGFLGGDESNVSEFEKANTVDLMKYILSYASNPTVSSGRSGLYSRELVDSSVRNLLHELAVVSFRVPTKYMPNSGHQLSGRDDGQTATPFGQNIEMKRGDWICPRCNFMNFARNTKCVECEETRSRRQLTSREWECPQCNFFNYGRNLACLRCDCGRPGVPLFNSSVHCKNRSLDYNIDTALGENEEKAQQSLSKISQLSNKADMNIAASDTDFPERTTMLRKGENRFVVSSSEKTVERRADNGNLRSTNSTLNTPFSMVSPEQSLHHPSGHNSNNAPFITHSSDTSSWMDDEHKVFNEIDESKKSDENCSKDLHPTDKVQGDKSQRWFKTQNVQDQPSAVSDDFPEIMPMRKGENRFVLSQRKDRSLTSPKYKRQVAMDQANNSNFVPFVPFPPGYFAQKDTEQTHITKPPINPTSDASPSRRTPEPEKSDNKGPSGSTMGISSTVNRNTLNDERSGTSEQGRWSLEGSATDPLDMSEEAKAERWFKRVAHIKDISELSLIPDEDFPSILPMRKGVNRFVVSKRKTPLERRLTSKQHRNGEGKS